MHDLSIIEESYNQFMSHLNYWLPEGLIDVNLQLLYQLDLLHFQPVRTGLNQEDTHFTGAFQMIESPEKMTMINDEFVVWITPVLAKSIRLTYVLIALNRETGPHLEMAYITAGIYNRSPIVLKLLDKFLCDLKETENLLTKLS